MSDLVIHGHFYQPPRENPWTGKIDRDPKVYPYHDWNERIHHECYRANAFARIFDGYNRVERIVNNFEGLSFNFGPTLLSWLEYADPPAYKRLVDADRSSVIARGGHGNAIAQAYNHTILPLATPRDRVTQIRWGLADFRRRFEREPEAMWMPETACNDATLGALIDEGMKYAILAPYQAARVRPLSGGSWVNAADGAIDSGVAYRYLHRDGSGRHIALFFYDGPASRSIAFEGTLSSSQAFVGRLAAGRGGPGRLIHVATDGESYGHHFRHGELTLAHAITVEGPARNVNFTNYGAFLAENPPTMEVEIAAGPDGQGTSWSCAHGVGRWYRDCGCNTDSKEGWNQAWRSPLRQALDLLHDEADAAFEDYLSGVLSDPWKARDGYIDVYADPSIRERWLVAHQKRPLSDEQRVRVLTFLELARSAQFMYTSCGWFFSDLAGIEPRQVMAYAGHALDLMDELGVVSPRERFLEVLAQAKSNVPSLGNGADIFVKTVEPLRVSPARIALHLAISSLVEPNDERGEETGTAGGHHFKRTGFHVRRQGRLSLATCRLSLEHAITGLRHEYAAGSMHLGGVDFYAAAREFAGTERFEAAATRIWSAFPSASLPTLLRILQQELGPNEGGLEALLPDGREQVSELAFGNVIGSFVEEYGRLYSSHQRVLEMLHEAGLELPKELRLAAEFALGRQFMQEIKSAHRSLDPAAYRHAIEIADEALRRGYEIDRSAASETLGDMIAEAVARAMDTPAAARVRTAMTLIELARRLRADAELGRAQETLYQALGARDSWPEGVSLMAIALGFSPSVVGRRESLIAELTDSKRRDPELALAPTK
jgi:alpha-amylase/alpha-mannosidase (GH57 family)